MLEGILRRAYQETVYKIILRESTECTHIKVLNKSLDRNRLRNLWKSFYSNSRIKGSLEFSLKKNYREFSAGNPRGTSEEIPRRVSIPFKFLQKPLKQFLKPFGAERTSYRVFVLFFHETTVEVSGRFAAQGNSV